VENVEDRDQKHGDYKDCINQRKVR
jgi:hypothetical protein